VIWHYTESEIEFQRVVLIMTVIVKNKTRTPVVPPSVRRRAGHRNGEDLEFSVSGGVITIAPKRPAADDEHTPEQRRRIDRGINRSLKEYGEGKGAGPFAAAEEFLDDLHRASARLGAKKNFT
jgi:bifunctional DNA-binding transcriptional regulator/antitoxin component of YhaV-PrlF toxin-antitoxin module